MTKILTGTNLKVAKEGRKQEAADYFITPVLDGKVVVLKYKHGKLLKDGYNDAQKIVLKRSGVPLDIYNERGFGGQKISRIEVVGKLVKYAEDKKTYFVAVDARFPDEPSPFNQILRLNLLHMRGFRTILPLCSWLAVTAFPPKKAEKLLQQRLKEIREVADGERAVYWQSSTLWRNKKPTPISGKMVKSLELHNDLGFKAKAA